jgi:sugar lactone lactonase YvrE
MVIRTFLALLAGAALFSGCDARNERAGDGRGVDAPGILVFSGLPSGSYLHAIRPDGSSLKEIQLPATCSPKDFTRDGRVLSCDEWTNP